MRRLIKKHGLFHRDKPIHGEQGGLARVCVCCSILARYSRTGLVWWKHRVDQRSKWLAGFSTYVARTNRKNCRSVTRCQLFFLSCHTPLHHGNSYTLQQKGITILYCTVILDVMMEITTRILGRSSRVQTTNVSTSKPTPVHLMTLNIEDGTQCPFGPRRHIYLLHLITVGELSWIENNVSW